MTPNYIEPNCKDAMRAQMDEHERVVGNLARKHDAVHVNTQAKLEATMRHDCANALAWDRVHPTQVGLAVFAAASLDTIGLQR